MAANYERVCIPGNLIRSTLYSDTYRATLQFGTAQGEIYDIVRFPGLVPEDKYSVLRSRLPEDVNVGKYVDSLVKRNLLTMWDHHADEELENVLLRPVIVHRDRETNAFYMVQPPHSSLLGNYNVKANSISYRSLLNLTLRLIIAIEKLNRVKIHIGDIKLENLSFRETGEGRTILINSLIDHTTDKDEPSPHPMSIFEDDAVVLGEEKRTILTDLHALGRFAWTVASGNTYTTVPDLTVEPKYASESFKAVLFGLLSEDNIDLPYHKQLLKKELSSITEGSAADYTIPLIQGNYRRAAVQQKKAPDPSPAKVESKPEEPIKVESEEEPKPEPKPEEGETKQDAKTEKIGSQLEELIGQMAVLISRTSGEQEQQTAFPEKVPTKKNVEEPAQVKEEETQKKEEPPFVPIEIEAEDIEFLDDPSVIEIGEDEIEFLNENADFIEIDEADIEILDAEPEKPEPTKNAKTPKENGTPEGRRNRRKRHG